MINLHKKNIDIIGNLVFIVPSLLAQSCIKATLSKEFKTFHNWLPRRKDLNLGVAVWQNRKKIETNFATRFDVTF